MDNDYKTVCDTCGKKTWYEKEQQCHCEYEKTKTCKTCGHTKVIEPIKMVRCKGTLKPIDNSNLDRRFDYYYQNSQRVEVLYKDGSKERFYIGKSTGWKPIYLMIKKSNSFGGEALYSENIKEIKGLNKFR